MNKINYLLPFFIFVIILISSIGCTRGGDEIDKKVGEYLDIIKNSNECDAREKAIIQISNYFTNNQIKSEELISLYQSQLISISKNDSCENVRYAASNALFMFRKYGSYTSRSNIKITTEQTPRVGHTMKFKAGFSTSQDTTNKARFNIFWSEGLALVREEVSLPEGFEASPEGYPEEGISFRGSLKANEKKEIEFELKIEKTGTFGIRGKLFAPYTKGDYEQIDDQLYLIVTESGGEVTRTAPQMEAANEEVAVQVE